MLTTAMLMTIMMRKEREDVLVRRFGAKSQNSQIYVCNIDHIYQANASIAFCRILNPR